MDKRSDKFKAVLDPVLEPGDFVVAVGKDDSCCLLFGPDYREAYGEGQVTPGAAFPSVMLGMKILGELLTGQMRLCMPKEPGDVQTLTLTDERVQAFKAAMRGGTLTPDVTFPVVAAAYQELVKILDGHMAACLPNEYRKAQEQMKLPPSKRLWESTGDPKKRVS